MICPNCNHNNPEGSKFCEECGSKLPEPKKVCPSCGTELNGYPKFCPECGFKLGTGQKVGPSGVSIGDKNVIAGDLNVVGKKEEFNVSGNATIIRHEDDTKKIETCPICGKSYFRIDGRLCKSCGRYVCSDCFDEQHYICADCRKKDMEEAESRYVQALEDVLADGMIDKDEAIKLNTLRNELGLSVSKAKELESRTKEKRAHDILSSIDEINLDKAITLFVSEREEEAFEIAKRLHSHHLGNDNVSKIYYLSGASIGAKEVYEKAKEIEYDVPLKFVILFLYYCRGSDYSMADKEIQRACALWPDNVLIRSCEVILLRKTIEEDFSERLAVDIRGKISSLPEKSDDPIESFFIKTARRTFIEEADSILFKEDAFKDDVVSIGKKVFDFSKAEENREKYIHLEYSSRAFDLYRQSMYTGSGVALFRMAICHALGCGVKQSADKAIEFLNKASEAGYSLAFTRLGDCYQWGRGVETDYSKAEELYKKATELGDAIAPNNLGCLYEFRTDSSQEDKHKAFEYYSICAHQGLPQGQYNLGKMYFKGIGVEVDEVEAVKWFTKAAEQGFCESQKKLAECYKEGCGVERDYAESFRWYSLAAESGDMDAQFCLACAFFDGEGIEEDQEKAVIWFRKAAEQGDSNAQLFLGRCFRDGDGVEQDYSEAVKWYLKAADNGNAFAQFELGEMYFDGKGVEQDFSLADKWFKIAAEQGYPSLQYDYASMLDTGLAEQCGYDDERVLEWYRKAAEQGFVDAYLKLAEKYDELFEEDDERTEEYAKNAFEWYMKSAESGLEDEHDCSEAEYNVALGFFYGRGVESNRKEALTWFVKAAGHGHHGADERLMRIVKDACEEEAQMIFDFFLFQAETNSASYFYYDIAMCYSSGKGVSVDYKAAIDWYIKAAMNRSSEAEKYLENLTDEDVEDSENGVVEMRALFINAIKTFDNEQFEQILTANWKFGFFIIRKMEESVVSGDSLAIDFKSLYDWFKKNAKHDPQIAIELGVIVFHGVIFDKEKEEALGWFSHGLDIIQSDSITFEFREYMMSEARPCMWRLGLEIIDDFSIPDNERKAYDWLKRVVEIDCFWEYDEEGLSDNERYLRWFGELLFWGYLGDCFCENEYYQNKLKKLEDIKEHKGNTDSKYGYIDPEDSELCEQNLIEKGKKLLEPIYIENLLDESLSYLERGNSNNLISVGRKIIESPLLYELIDAEERAIQYFERELDLSTKVWELCVVVDNLTYKSEDAKWKHFFILFLEKRLSKYISSNEKEHAFVCEIALGLLYYLDREYEKAFNHYRGAFSYGPEVEQRVSSIFGLWRHWFLDENCAGNPISLLLRYYYVNFGRMYYYGKGVEKDYDKAFPLLLKATQDYEDTSAMNIIGNCYAYGRGTSKDAELAFKYALDVAEKTKEGDDEFFVGRCYDEGLRGRKKDHKLAKEWFMKAAEHGCEEAKKRLGLSGLFTRFKKR